VLLPILVRCFPKTTCDEGTCDLDPCLLDFAFQEDSCSSADRVKFMRSSPTSTSFSFPTSAHSRNHRATRDQETIMNRKANMVNAALRLVKSAIALAAIAQSPWPVAQLPFASTTMPR
jgi:hypothetical protein